MDARIFYIWQLLDALSGSSQQRSLSDVGLLTPSFGAAAIPYIRNAFIQYWRLGMPQLRSERPAALINTDTAMDRLGIVAISIEAATNPNWISTLSDTQAELAAIYATLEINGFPAWFKDLCMKRPRPVRKILLRCVASELSDTNGSKYREALERIARAHETIVALVALDMLAYIKDSVGASVEVLSELPPVD